MALVVPSGFAHVSMELEIPSDAGPAYVTFGVAVGAPTSIGDAIDDVANAYALSGSMVARMTSAIVLRSIYMLWNDGGVLKSDQLPYNVPGTAATAPLAPPQVAAVVRKATGFAGRSQRGRNYWPGLQDGAIDDDGTLASATYTAWQASLTTFFNGLDAGATDLNGMVLLHDAGSPTIGATAVSAYVLDPKVGTQRGRVR